MDLDGFSIGLLFDWIDTVMVPMLSGGINNLVPLVAMIAGPAVTLYFVIWAIRQLNDEQPYTEIMWLFFKLSAVMSFALNPGFFTSTVIPIINGIPQQIAAAFSGSEDTVHLLDSMIENLAYHKNLIWEKTKIVSWSGIDVGSLMNVGLAIIIVYILGGIYIGLATLILFVANLVVMVIIALGPIFIACAFFKATNNFFTLWVNQLVNYMLLFVIFSLIFTVQASLINGIVSLPPIGKLTDGKVLGLFITYIVSIGTITIIPVLASSLSGGIGLNGVVGGTAMAGGALVGKPLGALSKLMKKQPRKPDLGNNKVGNGGGKLPG